MIAHSVGVYAMLIHHLECSIFAYKNPVAWANWLLILVVRFTRAFGIRISRSTATHVFFISLILLLTADSEGAIGRESNDDMNYNKQLDNLFIRWMESLDEEQRNLFCKDGLMLKADKPEEYVDERWNKMQRRVMFLVKDKNTPDGDDTRRWSLDENMCKLSGGNVGRTGFFPNIARIFYGLQVITADNKGVGADELTKDMPTLTEN